MPDEARDYVRAAQLAELRGDLPQAVDFLLKAAALYRASGGAKRALSILRHANRLDGARRDVVEQIRAIEWVPEDAMAVALGEAPKEVEVALEALEALVGPPVAKAFAERGPVRADAALNAWCSFCCRPRGEVGELVAGPAGAFVCVACARLAAGLLGEPAVPAAVEPRALPAVELIGHQRALAVIEEALEAGVQVVLLLGPEGVGKTALLDTLAARGWGARAKAIGLRERSESHRLLVDVDGPSAEFDAQLEEFLARGGDRQVVVAVRGQEPKATLTLAGDGGPRAMFSTEAIAEALGEQRTSALADRAQAVVTLAPLSVNEMVEFAGRFVAQRAAEVDLTDDLVLALAAEAARSGRGGHELRAMVRRLPAGSWALAGALKRPRKSRKAPKSG